MKTWSERCVGVIGAGKTGQSVARFLAARGARVRLFERTVAARSAANWPPSVDLLSDDRIADLHGVDLIVPSPGIAREHVLLRAARTRDIPVWSEIELAARFLPCPILAITGTNGKSTTTTLLGAMLAAAGTRVFVGGNLGTPLLDALSEPQPYEAAVVEVSSFQLEWIEAFRARVAVILNLTPDHQDRYASVDDYGEAKARVLATQAEGDYAILNRDDPWVWEQRHRTRASVISFGRDAVEFGTFVDGHDVVVWGASGQQRFDLRESPLTGEHNRENIQAAVTAATAWGLNADVIRTALRSTAGLPHRLELVREYRGVRYYDDSKGTNVGAVEKSLCSFPSGVIILLGGYDKGGDFTTLNPLLRERAAHVLCFGAAGPHIAGQLDPALAPEILPSMADAVARAAVLARPGNTVVLSPGCASFDEFRDYQERGERFRAAVAAL